MIKVQMMFQVPINIEGRNRVVRDIRIIFDRDEISVMCGDNMGSGGWSGCVDYKGSANPINRDEILEKFKWEPHVVYLRLTEMLHKAAKIRDALSGQL